MMRNPFSDSRNRAAAQMAVQNVVLPVLLFTLIVDAALSCYDLGISMLPVIMSQNSGPAGAGRFFAVLYELQGDFRAVVTAAAQLFGVYILRKRIALNLNLFREDEQIRRRAAFSATAAGIARTAFYIASAVVISVLLNALFSVTGLLPSSAADMQTMEIMYSASPAAAAAVFGFVSPFAEEMVFRGLALAGLRMLFAGTESGKSRSRAEWTAVLLSALLFGLYHLNPVQMLYAFLMGIWIGAGMVRTGKFSTAVMMHMAVNLVSVFLTYRA